jgi:riboflavin kinase / FMN adenylyltransferase
MTTVLCKVGRSRIAADPSEVGLGPAAVAIGQFDGVHRGHRRLIAECRRRAARDGLASGVVTFADHPAALLAPERAPALLSTTSERIALLAGCGVDFVLVLPLTERLLRTSAGDFVEKMLIRDLAVRAVVVGRNFRFGHRASGDPDLLARLGRRHGMESFPLELVDDAGLPVSSTRIRAEIAAGRVGSAAAMLERPHSLMVTATSIGPHAAEATAEPGMAVPGPGTYRGALVAPAGRSGPASVSVRPAGTLSITTDLVLSAGEPVRVDFLAGS